MNTTTLGKVGKSKEFEPDPLDQVYFRKKDEISRYTEVFVKQKVKEMNDGLGCVARLRLISMI